MPVSRVAADAGWRLETADVADALPRIRADDAQALLLPSASADELAGIVSGLRRESEVAAALPILAGMSEPWRNLGPLAGVDDVVHDAAALRSALDRWKPLGTPHPGPRLARMFGATVVKGLLGRFRTELVAILDHWETTSRDPAIAHRLAGLSGTLGLVDLGEAWRALDVRSPASIEQARIVSRKTILLLRKPDLHEPPPTRDATE